MKCIIEQREIEIEIDRRRRSYREIDWIECECETVLDGFSRSFEDQ